MDTTHLNLVLVEDHEVLRGLLTLALEDAGHQVTALSCAEELEDEAAGQSVDVFLIDITLPGEDGFSLTARVRASYPLAGLILVTARSNLRDKLEGYACGADLYLTKPLEVEEVCAAVSSIGRRMALARKVMTTANILTLSQLEMSVSQRGQPGVSLTAAEIAMLVTLSRAPGQRVAYWQIAEVLGLDLQTYPKASLEVRIVRLRKKLVQAGARADCIESIRNHGYQLCVSLQVV
jgi:DNA-binding response OmpR family regulator